jgi:four helix bundle protein
MPEWIKSFRDLRVWQQAFSAAVQSHELSKRLPREEQYSMTDQIRRSSWSVSTSIAEAWGKRRYGPAFISRLNDSQAEAFETQGWLLFAVQFGFVEQSCADSLIADYDQFIQSIEGMIIHADDWKPKKSV